MKYQKTITILVIIIAVFSFIAAAQGMFSSQGPGPYEFTSIHGQQVLIYGKGIYQHMSAEVAPQGIAQDVVTMFVGIPLLIGSLYFTRKGLLRARLVLSGVLGYFLVTYLFYLTMGMFNRLYLAYVLILSASFYAFIITMFSFDVKSLVNVFNNKKFSLKFAGGFLVFNSIAIGLLWLSVIVPPLLKGAFPIELEHYTTMIVQGLDLALLLPASFISGVLFVKRKPISFLLAPVYLIFLSILMTALTAKVIAMKAGIPVSVIIPAFNVITIFCSYIVFSD